jgi:hypothetical protein
MNHGHARYAITNGEALSKCPSYECLSAFRRRSARSRSNRCWDADSGHGSTAFRGPGSQLGDARDGGVIVEAVVNEKAAHHGGRATLAAPAVEVNDSAGGDFISDAREDPVVAIPVNDAVVRNGMSEVMDFPSCSLRRELQCIPIRVEMIVRSRQIDD